MSTAARVRDETFVLIYTAVSSYDPKVKMYWEGVVANSPPAITDVWLRGSLQHTSGRQSSLAGEDGTRRWSRSGIVSVQCFAPLAYGSVQKATQLACITRDALQGSQTTSCVWFRNARIIEVGEDGDWFNVNAIIDFDYDELR